MALTVADADRATYLAVFGKLTPADEARVLEGFYDGCTSMQAIVAARQQSTEKLIHEITRLRGFIKSIDDDWIANNPAGDDDWNDGYEDCLSDYALKARKILGGASLQEVLP